ncbi:uncharacterized mitochondrial protein AtMg00810-like [Magnolia sinica]|uniref:uncharacterized mitochondrial protein AtMg00810-like n=1 Tax=Magnolia sinica TaxID=86752 RepID=UPI0026597B83|nr:uncharacterized mitochondrial protein AtMg00810-like [Magnolia sinica]
MVLQTVSCSYLDRFYQSNVDHSLFTKTTGTMFTAILIYVDDIFVTGNDLPTITALKNHLGTAFDILSDAGQLGSRPAYFPMERHLKLNDSDGTPLVDPAFYCRLIGHLIFLTISSPDITYTVNLLIQFMHAPHEPHQQAALQLLQYLKTTPGYGLFFSSAYSFQLSAYCDSDWASCFMTRRSTTGFVVKLGDSPISWHTKKQSTVSRSSTEAEYHAIANTSCEIKWLQFILRDC